MPWPVSSPTGKTLRLRGESSPGRGPGDRRDPATGGQRRLGPRRRVPVAEAIVTTKAVLAAQPRWAGGEIVLRADSAFYARKVIAAARRGGVRFSVTIRIDKNVRRAIEAIPDGGWVEIKYPHPIWDDDQRRFVSRAQIAETTYTAFDKPARDAVTARLIVHRIPDLNKTTVDAKGELFPVWRYHAFTDNPFVLVQAEEQHRGHAVIEQVLAELIDGPLAHLPSGRFDANNAWLTCIAIAHNLTRAAATLAGRRYATARPATVRRHLTTWPDASPATPGASQFTCPSTGPGSIPTVHSDPRATDLTVHMRYTRRPRGQRPQSPPTSTRFRRSVRPVRHARNRQQDHQRRAAATLNPIGGSRRSDHPTGSSSATRLSGRSVSRYGRVSKAPVTATRCSEARVNRYFSGGCGEYGVAAGR